MSPQRVLLWTGVIGAALVLPWRSCNSAGLGAAPSTGAASEATSATVECQELIATSEGMTYIKRCKSDVLEAIIPSRQLRASLCGAKPFVLRPCLLGGAVRELRRPRSIPRKACLTSICHTVRGTQRSWRKSDRLWGHQDEAARGLRAQGGTGRRGGMTPRKHSTGLRPIHRPGPFRHILPKRFEKFRAATVPRTCSDLDCSLRMRAKYHSRLASWVASRTSGLLR